MNYSIYYPNNCGCQGNNQGIYGTNMWNPNNNYPGSHSCGHQQDCNGCLEVIKGLCVWYTGANLTNTGINQNDNLNVVLGKLDTLFAIQATKNTNILAALNDINDRLNALEGGADQDPYTLL